MLLSSMINETMFSRLITYLDLRLDNLVIAQILRAITTLLRALTGCKPCTLLGQVHKVI